jgi:hypothetical protein
MSFDTSGPVNNRGWWFRQVNTGILYLETIDDAGTPQVQACNIERNGTWSFTSSFTSHPKGAYFPARSSNPGLLDHYEEGNWTPILFSVDGGQGTAYSGVVGVYTKIGQVVNCFFAIGLQAANWTSGLINIGGFPFTNIDTYSVGFFDYYNPTVNTIRIQMHMPPNTNAVFLPYQTVPNSNPHEAYIQASQMQTGVIFRGQITYRTNT